MQIKKTFFSILFLSGFLFQLSFLSSQAFSDSQDKKEKSSDSVWLQSSPVFIGEEVFTNKIEAIKKEREPLALVLSGGSARAYAHIGVLRQLENANIKPDFIVANSMGAIIGLLYAAGFSPVDIEAIVSEVDLNTFFDIVFPLRGGLLSSRYFLDSLSRLFPDKTFDIQDSFIPIIIPTEDLYTKRQVLFAQGNIIEIMTASFAMSFMMEPVPYSIFSKDSNKTEEYFLVDSGTIDLGSLEIAKRFTDNIVISTALYDTKMNLKNPVTVLNRTFSIGKERQLVSDVLNFQPFVIRNDVEQFSFMDFTKVHEIIAKGDDSAKAFLNDKPEILHEGFSQDTDFIKLRALRQKFANNFITAIQKGLKPKSEQAYLGIKIRPNVSAIDYPEFLLSPQPTIGAYAFFDWGPFFTRAGLHSNIFETLGGDAFLRFSFHSGFEAKVSYHYTLPYESAFNDFSLANQYAALSLSWLFSPLKSFFIKPLVTAELETKQINEDFDLFSKFGLQFYTAQNPMTQIFRFSFEPNIFYMSYSFTQDLNTENLGFGFLFESEINPHKNIGLSYTQLFRTTAFGETAPLFDNDGFRGFLPNGFSPQKQIALSQFGLFWKSWNTGITAMEAFKLEALSFGIFTDLLYGTQIPLKTSSGFFSKQKISLAGLSAFNLETFIGWDFSEKTIQADIRFIAHF